MGPDDGAIVVTGASSGIGEATARLLAENGYRVVLVSRSRERLNGISQSLRGSDFGEHRVAPCDVSDARAVQSLRNDLMCETPIQGLVNAAGICIPATLAELTHDNWQATLDINLTGPFLLSQALADIIRATAGTGSIVNVASEAATLGMPGYAAYCASKAGLVGLTRALAAELAPYIRVNAISPGPVDTPMLRHEMELTGDLSAARAAELDRVPLAMIASADHIADAIVWVLTRGSMMTGSVVAVDGGTTGAAYGAARANG